VVSKAEVSDAELEPRALSIALFDDQNVAGLQISMDDLLLVHGLDPGKQLSHNDPADVLADTLIVEVLSECSLGSVAEYHVHLVSILGIHRVQLHDVGAPPQISQHCNLLRDALHYGAFVSRPGRLQGSEAVGLDCKLLSQHRV